MTLKLNIGHNLVNENLRFHLHTMQYNAIQI